MKFKILDTQGNLISKFDNLESVYNKGKKLDRALNHYYLEDIDNEIEIYLDEFMEAWENGERPQDLSMF